MRRFFLVFLLAVALPMFLVSVAVTVSYRRFSLDLAARRAAQALEPLAQGIDEEVRRTALLTATLSTDETFVDVVIELNRSRTPREQYEASQSIEQRLSAFFNYTNKIGAVLLYLRDQPVFLHRNNWLLFGRPLVQDGWFDTVTRAPNATVIVGDLDSYGLDPVRRPLLKVAVCPSLEAFERGFQAIVVAFRVPFLDQVAEGAPVDGEELLLVDGAHRIILCSSPEKEGTTIDASLLVPGVFRQGRTTYVTAPASIPSADWTLVSVTDFSRITRDVQRLGAISLWALLALLVAFGVYIEVFFQQVLRPINTLIAEMGKVEQGDWSVRVPIARTAELAHLGRSFNTMLAEMERLTAERERQERERALLELEALRLQINPHFLTNTLNSIKMLAALSNAEPIRRMTAALMRVVSSSFRGGGSLAALGEELSILEQYLFIMRVRYGDTFDVRIDVGEDLRGLRVLRMLLQPLVENAILHGLQGLDRRGELSIRGWLDGESAASATLLLEVRDNGKGATPERLAEALVGPQERHHGLTSIGLANIRRRITLNHGNGFSVEVASQPGTGTVALLRLPVIRKE